MQEWALRVLAHSAEVVAIGEIGLDYYRKLLSPADVQRERFRRQLDLAVELGLPVIVHNRDASAYVLATLEAWRPAHVGRACVFMLSRPMGTRRALPSPWVSTWRLVAR